MRFESSIRTYDSSSLILNVDTLINFQNCKVQMYFLKLESSRYITRLTFSNV